MTKVLVSDPLSEDGIRILKDSGMEVTSFVACGGKVKLVKWEN